jgi:hypothetical protein
LLFVVVCVLQLSTGQLLGVIMGWLSGFCAC